MPEWITGRNPVYETLRASRRKILQLSIAEGAVIKGRLKEISDLAEKMNIPIRQLRREDFKRLDPGGQGTALQVGSYPFATLIEMLELAASRDEPPFLLILDVLQDPQNLGTLLRTAEAAGVHGVLLPIRRSATVTPAVVNASSGASEHLLIAQANLAQSINVLKENGVWVVGLDAEKSAKLPDEIELSGPLALVVGSEGRGMRRLVRERCDLLMRLPMRGQVASLNAAVAGSIALYLASQARGTR
jgi:23S rRNA (guanosine2251-2'-O)-methyltransferase